MLPVKRTEGETPEARMVGNAHNNTLSAHYPRKDADGDLAETQEGLFLHVAKNIALAEAAFEAEKRGVELMVVPDLIKPDRPCHDKLAAEVFGKGVTAGDDETETTLLVCNVNKFAYGTLVPKLPEEVREAVVEKHETFEELMEQLPFVPNSPTLTNAGDELQQLSVCFIDSPANDITDIRRTARGAAEISQSGGGMGYAFRKFRPYGDAVGSTNDIAPGPITFMRAFDQMYETIA